MRDRFQPRNFMIMPDMGCDANCTYCFAPKSGDQLPLSALPKIIDSMEKLAPSGKSIAITFHGGEPLLAGIDYYREALPMLRERFGLLAHISMQSNLHQMTVEIARLFQSYNVGVGTSLDGFSHMCDAQRGKGYFQRTMRGMEILRQNGIEPHAICTFTPAHADKAKDVFRFFAGQGIHYSIHGAVRTIGESRKECCISDRELAGVYLDTLEAYKENLSPIRVGTLDSMVYGCFHEEGTICTFFDCLGHFAVYGPDGHIYPCQRFYGHREYAMGTVSQHPNEAHILASDGYKRLSELAWLADKSCGDCVHHRYCKGGCLYNMVAESCQPDPYCACYKAVFDKISVDMALEMGALLIGKQEGIATPLLSMAGDQKHPNTSARCIGKRKTGLEWAKTKGPDHIKSGKLNKCYLHVTFRCPMNCPHCYANAGKGAEMDVLYALKAVQGAQKAGFATTVITGGEPLFHEGIDELLAALSSLEKKGMRLVLRTSFGFIVPPERLRKLCEVFDEIVVSVDGDQESHDTRRGKDVYGYVLANLQAVKSLGFMNLIGICATLSKAERYGPEGQAVLDLCQNFGIPNLRFRPILPLGRAKSMANWEYYSCVDESELETPFSPRFSCGLGNNLYIEPDGNAYPCYAWCGKDKLLGNVHTGNVQDIVNDHMFYELRRHGVDTNERCKDCPYRYLCGGMCKAYVPDQENIDSGSFDCTERMRMFSRIEKLIQDS